MKSSYICSWCGATFARETTGALTAPGLSHGICDNCAIRVSHEIAQLPPDPKDPLAFWKQITTTAPACAK